MAIVNELNTLETKLDAARTKLAANLTTKGVNSDIADTLDIMADKVLNIPSGGGDVEITECTSLSITAKGVQYNQTTTTINYVAECIGKQAGEDTQFRFWGVATSEDFGTNDTTENRTITISYTFKNKTATTEIIQKWNNPDNPDLLEYEFSGSQSIVKINGKEYTFTSSPVKADLKLDLGIDKFTSAYEMFNGYRSNITKLITMPDTKDVTDMSGMFQTCSNFTSLDLSGWNTQNVTNMSNMFYNCTHFTSLDLSGWNTQNVTDMRYMFQNCSNLASINLSGWKLNSNVSTNYMFDKCSELTSIYMRGCDQTTIDKINEGIAKSGIVEGQITIVTV